MAQPGSKHNPTFVASSAFWMPELWYLRTIGMETPSALMDLLEWKHPLFLYNSDWYIDKTPNQPNATETR
jgi:hypothetical protein